MELYEILKDANLVDNHKDFFELFYLRAIKINDKILSDVKDIYSPGEVKKVTIGVREVLFA